MLRRRKRHLLHHGGDLLPLADVALDDARVGQRRRHALGLGLVVRLRIGHVIDHTPRAELAKGGDDAGADAARTARDQRHFAAEIEGVFHGLDRSRGS